LPLPLPLPLLLVPAHRIRLVLADHILLVAPKKVTSQL
jgi:hypothetical protein